MVTGPNLFRHLSAAHTVLHLMACHDMSPATAARVTMFTMLLGPTILAGIP